MVLLSIIHIAVFNQRNTACNSI